MNVFKYERIGEDRVRLTAPDGTTREAELPDDEDGCPWGPIPMEDRATDAIITWAEELGMTRFSVADGYDGEWVYGDHGTAETGPSSDITWQFIPAVTP